MKAITCSAYASPARLELVDLPTPEPGPGQVRVRTKASSVNALDWRLSQGEPWLVRLYVGLWRPHKLNIMGADVAGVVDALGEGVTAWQVGDEVFGDVDGVGYGGFSQYGLIAAERLARKPATMSFEEAAGLPVAGETALQALRDWAKLQSGERILISGASGGVGCLAVQIAKSMGAHVTALTSQSKQDFVRNLGADEVLLRDERPTDGRFDVALECGAAAPLGSLVPALRRGGRLVFVGGMGVGLRSAMSGGGLAVRMRGRSYASGSAKASGPDLEVLARMYEAGSLRVPIERVYGMDEVEAAVHHVASGAAMGKSIIFVD